jgi:hypothetical protein
VSAEAKVDPERALRRNTSGSDTGHYLFLASTYDLSTAFMRD